MKHLDQYICESQIIYEGFWSKLFAWLFRPFTKRDERSGAKNVKISDVAADMSPTDAKARVTDLQDTARRFFRKVDYGLREFDLLTIVHKPSSLIQDETWRHIPDGPWYEFAVMKDVTYKELQDSLYMLPNMKFQYLNADKSKTKIPMHLYVMYEATNKVLSDYPQTIRLYDISGVRVNDPKDAKKLLSILRKERNLKSINIPGNVYNKIQNLADEAPQDDDSSENDD